MAIIQRVDLKNSSDEITKVVEEHKAKGYRITNMKETLLHSVTAFRSLEDGIYNLQEELEKYLGNRAVLIFAYAISSNDDCIICSNYFKKLLIDNGIDYNTFAFSEDELLLIDYGKAFVENKAHVPQQILSRLSARFEEKEIVEITAFAAMLVANNYFNNAMVVELDNYLLDYKDR